MMKKISLLLAVLMVALFTNSAHASDVERVPSSDPPSVEAPAPDASPPDVVTSEILGTDKNITVNVVMPSVEPPAPSDVALPPVEESSPEALEAAPATSETVIWTTTKLLDESPLAGGASLSSVVQSVFGSYAPRTQTVTETATDGSTVTYTEYVSGLAGLDWYWLSGVAMFSLVLLSFFKLLGGVLKRG